MLKIKTNDSDNGHQVKMKIPNDAIMIINVLDIGLVIIIIATAMATLISTVPENTLR